MSNLALYMIGAVAVTLALAFGAHLLGVPIQWIAVGVLFSLGLGVTKAVSGTRRRETPQ